MVFEMMLLFGFLFLAFWKRQIFLDIASGLILLFTGLSWSDDYAGISLVLLIFACYQFFNGIVTIFTSRKASQGLSQFKTWYQRIKGIKGGS